MMDFRSPFSPLLSCDSGHLIAPQPLQQWLLLRFHGLGQVLSIVNVGKYLTSSRSGSGTARCCAMAASLPRQLASSLSPCFRFCLIDVWCRGEGEASRTTCGLVPYFLADRLLGSAAGAGHIYVCSSSSSSGA